MKKFFSKEELSGRLDRLIAVMRRHPAIAALLIAAFILLVAFGAFLAVVEGVIHARREIIVPDLQGKTLEQALDAIASADLSLAKAAVEFDESFPPGTIIKQVPVPGLKVREGKVLRVTLSSGGQVVFAPDLTNRPLPDAQNALRSVGLIVGAVTEAYSQLHESGWVMEQTPLSGAVLNRGQMVDLRISKGPPPEGMDLMPEFVNQPLSRAMEWIHGKAWKAEVREVVKPEILPGMVISQTPKPDDLVNGMTPIAFEVSQSTTAPTNTQTVRYEVPAGSDRVLVRMVIRDERGEREVFSGYQNAGALVEVPVVIRGASRVRIFVNGVLIEERLLE
ncbi:MAG TPA: PASTA domain-containing protein [Elusimicrobiota bacterium]|nr:PASTA domain-containing protein [Elusimicrobiota bacterium]